MRNEDLTTVQEESLHAGKEKDSNQDSVRYSTASRVFSEDRRKEFDQDAKSNGTDKVIAEAK